MTTKQSIVSVLCSRHLSRRKNTPSCCPGNAAFLAFPAWRFRNGNEAKQCFRALLAAFVKTGKLQSACTQEQISPGRTLSTCKGYYFQVYTQLLPEAMLHACLLCFGNDDEATHCVQALLAASVETEEYTQLLPRQCYMLAWCLGNGNEAKQCFCALLAAFVETGKLQSACT